MPQSDKKKAPDERTPLTELRELGNLDAVLNSNASLEVKAACIEMEIEARERRKAREGQSDAQPQPGNKRGD